MKYYELAIKGLYLDNLIFQSESEISPLSEVIVDLKTRKNCKAIVLKQCEKPNFITKDIKEITPLSLSKEQFILAEFISYYHSTKLGFTLSLFESSKPYQCEIFKTQNAPILSPKQEKALNFLKQEQNALLFADTGSGKTEIYITLIKESLEKGQQVLLLMPEISLTPQMQKRLSLYFGEDFFMWHSKISKKKKKESLEKFNEGKALLIAGARSALFLPFRNLGLIIVDEEHDHSYKAF